MPNRGILLGRIFGTDIYASGGFLMLLVLLLLMNRGENGWVVVVWILALVLSVLVHEFGHVFAVKRFHTGSCFVMLWTLGGLCVHEPTRVIGKRIAISVMGPAFGVALGLVFLALDLFVLPEAEAPSVVATFVGAMVYINILYSGINLLPILPLDGGQASLAALESRLGVARSRSMMRYVSVGFAGLGMAAALALGQTFWAILAGLLLMQNLLGARAGV